MRRMRKAYRRRHMRRAAVIVQVAVMSTLIMGFGALAVDVGMLYTSKTELQAAADAAALAGAAQLGGETEGDPEQLAREAAQEYAMKHRVAGDPVYLDQYSDVELGKAVYNPATEKFEFQPGGSTYDSVRVTVKRTSESPSGPIPLMFANIYGAAEKDMWAQASAVLTPRDVAVVIDLSNSMCWDSQLRYWNRNDGGYANLRDVWCALDGPEPSRPYIPGSELETEYAGDLGPTVGRMSEWGDPLLPGAYSASSDPGLVYLPKGSYVWATDLNPENVLGPWNDSRANDMLVDGGYDVFERWSVLSNEQQGYMSAAATDGLGFTTRVVHKTRYSRVYGSTSYRDWIVVYVTSDADTHTPALSNIQISLPASALSLANSTAGSMNNHPHSIVNPDPQTGLVGIKFEDTTLGEDGVSETEWFAFDVPASSYVSDVDIVCKASPQWSPVSHYINPPPDGYGSASTWRWRYRVATVLGLADWASGMGSHPGGNGDSYVDDSYGEITWIPMPEYALDWQWYQYIDYSRSGFRYRYGLKTYTDYLMEKQPESYSTEVLWATPEQPLRAIKDAVQTMVNVIESLDSLDHMSLEIFASTARHQVNLTDDLQSISQTLYTRQSGHYDRSTNLGGGLQKAIAELRSDRARSASAKVIVLMSDGVPNIDEDGHSTGDGSEAAKNFALDQAEIAADAGFRIYAVSVGYNVDRELMQAIAATANGQEFYAVGTPEEYTEQLEQIFRTLGGKRPVALFE
ncbi:MAG: VWA domain-containing protein [Phycisphaerae bacterium]